MGGATHEQAGMLALALLFAPAGALLLAPAASAETAVLALEELGAGPVPVAALGNAELSGITWLGEGRFLSVDDGLKRLIPLEVTLDAASGAIQQVVVGEYVTLAGAKDPEGIARRPNHASMLVVDEGTRDIREYDPESGEQLRVFAPPPMYDGRVKKNNGFESIAAAWDGHSFWIATEGPLRNDGGGSSAMAGAWVRLQRLDASLAPIGQYAYRTDPGLGFVGVVELLLTPEGELLVLERALTGGGFSARIFAGGRLRRRRTSRRSRSSAIATDFVPAKKVKLWERNGRLPELRGDGARPRASERRPPGAARLGRRRPASPDAGCAASHATAGSGRAWREGRGPLGDDPVAAGALGRVQALDRDASASSTLVASRGKRASPAERVSRTGSTSPLRRISTSATSRAQRLEAPHQGRVVGVEEGHREALALAGARRCPCCGTTRAADRRPSAGSRRRTRDRAPRSASGSGRGRSPRR